MTLLLNAFGVRPDQVSGPSWLFEPNTLTPNRYDIVANVPPGTTGEQANEMLRNLLVDRFHLVFHTVRKDFEGYALTVAKGGPKLTAAAPPDGPLPTRQPGVRQEVDKDGFPVFPPGYPNIVGITREGVYRLSGRTVTTGDLLGVLRSFLDTNRLEDKTGLTGQIRFKVGILAYRTAGSGKSEGQGDVSRR